MATAVQGQPQVAAPSLTENGGGRCWKSTTGMQALKPSADHQPGAVRCGDYAGCGEADSGRIGSTHAYMAKQSPYPAAGCWIRKREPRRTRRHKLRETF